jgi:hypothetical protein
MPETPNPAPWVRGARQVDQCSSTDALIRQPQAPHNVPIQLDLFTARNGKRARRIIAGRVRLSPKKQQPDPANEPAPFDDDISDIGF